MYSLLILFFLVSITFSFLCSIWEAVLLSITPSFTQLKLKEGGELGASLKVFKEDIDRPLAAILTLNTIAHTVGAIGVGAQASHIWGASLMSTVVVPVGMTLAILLLSEIIPKTIGANYWRELAPFTVTSLNVLLRVLAPLVWLSQIITGLLKKDKNASVLSRADFTAMAELGHEQGVFDAGESRMLQNLMRFEQVRAQDVMTPRTVVVSAEASTPMREFLEAHPQLRFSRILIHEGSPDHVLGYFLKDQMLAHLVEEPDSVATVGSLRRELITVEEDFPLPRLFEELINRREHIALVHDRYGGMAGIVTTEDVIETLIGYEIVDEVDTEEDMQELARKRWRQRARRLGLVDTEHTTG